MAAFAAASSAAAGSPPCVVRDNGRGRHRRSLSIRTRAGRRELRPSLQRPGGEDGGVGPKDKWLSSQGAERAESGRPGREGALPRRGRAPGIPRPLRLRRAPVSWAVRGSHSLHSPPADPALPRPSHPLRLRPSPATFRVTERVARRLLQPVPLLDSLRKKGENKRKKPQEKAR